jgi:hypothetical protein
MAGLAAGSNQSRMTQLRLACFKEMCGKPHLALSSSGLSRYHLPRLDNPLRARRAFAQCHLTTNRTADRQTLAEPSDAGLPHYGGAHVHSCCGCDASDNFRHCRYRVSTKPSGRLCARAGQGCYLNPRTSNSTINEQFGHHQNISRRRTSNEADDQRT